MNLTALILADVEAGLTPKEIWERSHSRFLALNWDAVCTCGHSRRCHESGTNDCVCLCAAFREVPRCNNDGP